MRPIGAKTLTISSVFFGVLSLTLFKNILSVEKLRSLTPDALFCIALFTLLIGTWSFSFWYLSQPSRFYFRLSNLRKMTEAEVPLFESSTYGLLMGFRHGGNPRELPPLAMRFLCLGLCFLISILCFNSRSVEKLKSFVSTSSSDGQAKTTSFGYCPDLESKTEVKVALERKPGCSLVYRAFELGFMKSLGSCAQEIKEKKMNLCKLRLQDEPYLHFAGRKLKQVFGQINSSLRLSAAFMKQLDYFRILTGRFAHVVEGAPKASHHIFTNLPYPRGKQDFLIKKYFKKNKCISQYRDLPHIFKSTASGELEQSQIFEHVYGQLLFNPKYEEASGLCTEFEIHWDSNPDACDKLAQDPEKFLNSIGILKTVTKVLSRIDEKWGFMRLQVLLKSIYTNQPPEPPPPAYLIGKGQKPKANLTPQSIVSFQCVMRDERMAKSEFRQSSFTLFQHDFQVSQVRFVAKPAQDLIHTEMYKDLSQSLIARPVLVENSDRSFNYFGGSPLFFTDLEELKNVDIFSSSNNIINRPDLLEIYPYYHHLYQFVLQFRSQYRLERTRL